MTECEAGEETVFSHTYEGVSDGYLCSDGTVSVEECSGNVEIKGFEAETVTNLYGYLACGKRDASSYRNAVRVETTECPIEYEACSTSTDAESTICVPTGEKDTKCPITWMQIVSASQIAPYQASTNYEVHEFSTVFVVTSQFVGNNLPITDIRIQTRPCMNWAEGGQTYIGADFYPLEKSQTVECSTEPNTGLRFDPRFTEAGLALNPWVIEE